MVGLGKSIIASAIAYNLDRIDESIFEVVIICPPHLQEQWNDYKSTFRFGGSIYSTGKIDDALRRHTTKESKPRLIILDEAHKHRNESTDSYIDLHKLCAGNYVMALSATPFNNDPKDIYALIKLFSTPGQSIIKTVENLSIAFKELFSRYKQIRKELRNAGEEDHTIQLEGAAIAEKLRMMIQPLVIRRSRLDLNAIQEYKDDLKKQNIEFSEVSPPEDIEYNLGTLSKLYIDTLDKIAEARNEPKNKDIEDDLSPLLNNRFIGARYKVALYLKEGSSFMDDLIDEDDDDTAKSKLQRLQQSNNQIEKFMRRLLVRRFESSIESFKITLQNMINSAQTIIKWYDKREEVPIYKKGKLKSVEELEDMNEAELKEYFNKLKEKDKGLIKIPISELQDHFRADVETDIDLLTNLLEEWNDVDFDPKYNFIRDQVLTSLQKEPNRKIIIFSEFSDTANYLEKAFKKDKVTRVFKYSSEDASKENKNIIVQNFDAGQPKEKQTNNYDILIATDAIAEGFNLHRAGTIINYDIPYNPTKVIQRIGRINRINKKVFFKITYL